METIQFTCGNCDKEISVLREHLGTRVQCPYCESVVEAVDPEGEPLFAGGRSDEAESIFGADEDNETDDLFGAPHSVQIEMPTDPKIAAGSPALADVTVPMDDDGDDFLSSKAPAREPAVRKSRVADEPAVEEPQFADGPDDFHDDDGEPVGQAPSALVERHRKPSMLTPLLLIFLIPYAAVMTIAVIYLYTKVRAQSSDQMEMLRDPNPNEKGPRRQSNLFPYDTELSASLKTTFNKPIRIGDVQVTPIKVVFQDESLELHVSIRNMSDDLQFNAMPSSFVTYHANMKDYAKPYSFVRSGVYKFFLDDVRWGKPGVRPVFSRVLGPGAEDVAILRTQRTVSSENNLARILKMPDRDLVWRLQVRRGFVSVNGRDVSATCVIGVEFKVRDIQRSA